MWSRPNGTLQHLLGFSLCCFRIGFTVLSGAVHLLLLFVFIVLNEGHWAFSPCRATRILLPFPLSPHGCSRRWQQGINLFVHVLGFQFVHVISSMYSDLWLLLFSVRCFKKEKRGGITTFGVLDTEVLEVDRRRPRAAKAGDAWCCELVLVFSIF